MKLDMSLTEVREIFNIILKEPSKIIELIRVDMKENVRCYLSELMKIELSKFLRIKKFDHATGNSQKNDQFPLVEYSIFDV